MNYNTRDSIYNHILLLEIVVQASVIKCGVLSESLSDSLSCCRALSRYVFCFFFSFHSVHFGPINLPWLLVVPSCIQESKESTLSSHALWFVVDGLFFSTSLALVLALTLVFFRFSMLMLILMCTRNVTHFMCNMQLIFQLILTRSCTFVYKSAQDSDTAAITVDASTKTIDFGLYRIGINEVCLEGSTNYSALGGHDNDTLLFNARNCHITSMITGAIAMLLVVTEYLKCKIRWGKLIESIFFFIAWTNGL